MCAAVAIVGGAHGGGILRNFLGQRQVAAVPLELMPPMLRDGCAARISCRFAGGARRCPAPR